MSLRQYTILIVDDSVEDRQVYRRYLEREFFFSYQIIETESGEEGLERLASLTDLPDLILLDYMLPDLNGLEFIDELKALIKTIPPTIMLTGQGNETVAVEAMKSGTKDYLVKGELTFQSLTASVKNILQQHNLQSQLVNSFQQQKLIAETSLRIRQSLDLAEILDTAVAEVGQLLNCDRVVIYRFMPDLSGDVVAESVQGSWRRSLGDNVIDTCFRDHGAAKYIKGETSAIDDIYQSHLSPCHIKLLEDYQAKAYAAVPILLAPTSQQEEQLWGLLIAHQCSNPRHWQTSEIELLDKLAVQMAIAIRQAELLIDLQSELQIRTKAEASLQQKATELERANRKLLKTTTLLKKRNQELDRFAYVTSHDLKAPLRAIANLATWLSEDLTGQIPTENQKQLDLMQSRVQRMENLIQGLLEYSRVGKREVPTELVDVQDLVDEAIAILPTLGFEITISPMPTLNTRPILLKQVFTNLLDNAIKYHPHKQGKIAISAEKQDDFYQFGVTDDGLGIDHQYHERIFTIFQTLQARDTIESTGIGLSIVKKIIEGQGGKIWVDSQLGQGSTFYFTWRK